eukprot:2319379-Rhodomonas_salina.1
MSRMTLRACYAEPGTELSIWWYARATGSPVLSAGMGLPDDPSVYVEDVFHKAVIEVNEEVPCTMRLRNCYAMSGISLRYGETVALVLRDGAAMGLRTCYAMSGPKVASRVLRHVRHRDRVAMPVIQGSPSTQPLCAPTRLLPPEREQGQ